MTEHDREVLVAYTSLTFRKIRGLSYGLLVVCGVVVPFQVLSTVPHPTTWAIVSGFLILGGIPCAVGQLSGRWVGEYVGLPLVVAALLGFGGLQLGVGGWLSVPGVSLLWAFAGIVYARWRDVGAVFTSQRRGPA
jgi:hypothetical protein